MKTKTQTVACFCLAACLSGLDASALFGADSKSNTSTTTATREADTERATTADRVEEQDIKVLERDPSLGQKRKQVTWLGLATDEASEALISQLRLDPGVGLIVTYVAPDSPAAKAGLQKNDVLVEFDGQALVHPSQLRKLVHVRKDGDAIKLVYYRAGKKDSASVTLSQTTERTGWLGAEQGWKDALSEWQGFQGKFRDTFGDAFHDQMKNLRRSLGDLRLEKEEVQREVRRGVEEARKAAEEVLRRTTKEFKKFDPAGKVLEDLAHGKLGVSKDTTVTVNSSTGSSVRTMVKADDTGTYVIVANPGKHLTVHDESGKLTFDGEIETSEQQATVPREIWDKVEPMVNKIRSAKDKRRELESESDR
jgi:hypothetical protein